MASQKCEAFFVIFMVRLSLVAYVNLGVRAMRGLMDSKRGSGLLFSRAFHADNRIHLIGKAR